MLRVDCSQCGPQLYCNFCSKSSFGEHEEDQKVACTNCAKEICGMCAIDGRGLCKDCAECSKANGNNTNESWRGRCRCCSKISDLTRTCYLCRGGVCEECYKDDSTAECDSCNDWVLCQKCIISDNSDRDFIEWHCGDCEENLEKRECSGCPQYIFIHSDMHTPCSGLGCDKIFCYDCLPEEINSCAACGEDGYCNDCNKKQNEDARIKQCDHCNHMECFKHRSECAEIGTGKPLDIEKDTLDESDSEDESEDEDENKNESESESESDDGDRNCARCGSELGLDPGAVCSDCFHVYCLGCCSIATHTCSTCAKSWCLSCADLKGLVVGICNKCGDYECQAHQNVCTGDGDQTSDTNKRKSKEDGNSTKRTKV